MSTSGETADLVVKESIQITESAVKLAGLGAKNLAALLIAIAKDNPKLAGKTGLKRLIQDGEELTIFSIKQDDLKGFQMESKRYGVLFYPIVNKVEKTGTVEIMAKAKEYGIAPNRIHIDPLVEMLCTSENGIETNIEVISTVREKYPTIHITAAVSNISFNLPVRKMVNLGFTVLAMNAGLDSAILDPTNRDMMGVIYATEALLGLDDYCMEYIGAYRDGLFGPVKQ